MSTLSRHGNPPSPSFYGDDHRCPKPTAGGVIVGSVQYTPLTAVSGTEKCPTSSAGQESFSPTDTRQPSEAPTIPHRNSNRLLPASFLSARSSRSLSLSPLFAYRPPTTQPTPAMSPRTRLTTLLRALCAHLHLYTRRSPAPAPIPEERTQITYTPIEYSRSSGDSTGSDDIPWAEHIRDGSNNAVRKRKQNGGSK